MARKIYMNVAEGDECRIAVLEDGKLYEFFIDRPSQLKHVGNIYKGIINNIEPGIQAAFVDIGLERNGFLHVSDTSYSYQDHPNVKDLYPKTLRIKQSLSEETLLHERKEQDVEEVDDFVGDGTQQHDSPHGTDEAEFLEKLDEEQPGHPVTDSPLTVEPQEKETPPSVPKANADAETETAPTADAAPSPAAGSSAETTPGENGKKKRRRRGRRGGRKHRERENAKSGETQGAAAASPADSSTGSDTAKPEPAPQSTPAPAETAETAKAEPDATPPKAESSKPKRRRTPKRRGGRLPKRVTDEVEKPASSAEPAPKTEPPRDPDAGPPPSGGDGPLDGPKFRFHRGPLPKIQNLLKRNQEVVVQVTKASQGGKGPGLSTFVSLPGRYMVLTPNSDRGGVSRKIEDGGARSDLRKMLDKLAVPEGMGVIVRTAAINRSFEDLQRDLNYLLRVWSVISERIHESEAPALLYTDSDPAIRTVRDYFTADTTEIIVDDKEVFERVLAFFDQLMPSFRDRVKLYEDDVPLFFSVGLENQLDHIFDKKVTLKSGGYLFIEQTEALISIDVNSGKFTSAGDAEKTAYQTNLEAIPEICRQLRLRDLAGIVCCDLIDMSTAKHRSDIEHALRRELRKDRARTKVAKMSPFGVIEMTRQRVRPSIKSYTYVSCPTCAGFGMVRSAETMCLSLLRRMKVALLEDRVHELAVQVHPHVLSHLHSEFRDDINDLEDRYEKRIVFEYAKDLILGQSRFFYMNDRGTRVLYDMDQRINTFAQTGPRAKTNVPVPVGASGAASPLAAQAQKDSKGRRRRGGRRQRERDVERQQREARIKSDSDKAVTFGDTLPEANVQIIKDDPKPEGRRRGRRGGRKVREREGKSDNPGTKGAEKKTSSGRKPASESRTGAASKPARSTSSRTSSARKAASTKQEATSSTNKKTETTKPTARKSPARKATAAKPAAKKSTAKTTTRKSTTAKKAPAAKKPAAKKTPAKKTPAKKPAAKKPAAKKPATKKPAAKKPAAKKPAAKKTPAKKTPAKKKS